MKIQLQAGTDNTLFATWTFDEYTKHTTTTTTTSKGSVKVGSWVTVKSGATWYNGVGIPSFVFSNTWKVVELIGSRAVINESKSGGHKIMSPIHVNNLVSTSTSSSTTTTTTKVHTLKHYSVKWYYDTGNGVWFEGSSSEVKAGTKNSIYSPPENARQVKVLVRPVSKTRKVNGKDTAYWTGTSGNKVYSTAGNPPEVPSAPTVSIDKFKLTAKIENISDARTDQIGFEVFNGNKFVKNGVVTVSTRRAIFSCTVAAGGNYRVRCCAINLYGKSKIYSGWSNYSSELTTIPTAPNGITSLKALSESSVYIAWNAVSNAKSYEIQYTTKKNYFDTSSQVTSITGATKNNYNITGMESGSQYFFRVRAVNDQGESGWCGIKSLTIGKKPSAPTTWSSTTTAVVGEPLNLYWIHNSEDNSSMTLAQLEIYVGSKKNTYTIQGTTDEETKDKTKVYSINTSKYTVGTKIKWRVRTAGVTKVYGDWSVQRVIDIYAPPTLDLALYNHEDIRTDAITLFPFIIRGTPGPATQAPIGYHISITANSSYNTIDELGNGKYIKKGESVYSKYFDTNKSFVLKLSASDIDLEYGIYYTITVTVDMNSGLSATSTIVFLVEWDGEASYEPDAEITYDPDLYSTFIQPYCINEDGLLIDDVLLSVYRREFDGSFTELVTDLENSTSTVITDPHPALNYARYRIVSATKTTGTIGYYDTPAYPVNESSIIIQWDDEWSNYDVVQETSDKTEVPAWTGSLVKLPYNIDVSESNSIDVSLVNYVGRKHPVSYYGTHLGVTATWNTVIPKDDTATIYSLRRLAIYTGDAYVREPSGTGYWANISVSFSQKYNELTIPVTLTITRVEGGA